MWTRTRARTLGAFDPVPSLSLSNSVSPHLYVKSAEESAADERRAAAQAATGSNMTPIIPVDERRGKGAKRLSSPERFEIRQLIASGVVSAADYPDIDEDFNTTLADPEVEEDIDIEVNDIEPAFLAGQTKITLDLSPVKIVKAPDG